LSAVIASQRVGAKRRPMTGSAKQSGFTHHNKTVVARLDRAIQYAAASRHYRWRLWILGRPVKPGDDSGVCFIQQVGRCQP